MRRSLLSAPILCVTLLVGGALTACGSDQKAATDPNPAGKPTVDIPDELPTELVITDLVEGTGEPAAEGDTVEVNYVGVRSADGKEIDNSYDRGAPYPVTLGEGGVIAGWDQGLIGIKVGGRRQLDIPAELAYGDAGSPPDIQPGDALTFVVEAVSITPGVDVPTADPADKPDVTIEPTSGATEVTSTDLVEGDGDTAAAGQTAYLQITVFRGDTAEELQSTWDTGEPAPIPLDDSTLPGLVEGVIGMKVGGRRQIVLPPEDGFGAEGDEASGIPGGTDMVLVVDLVLLTDAS